MIRTKYGREYRVGISNAFDYPEGYIVQLQSYPSEGETIYVTDYFDQEGRFQKRVRDDANIYLPVINSSTIFTYDTKSDNETILLKYP